MKKIITIALFLCFSSLAHAATNITTPTVSGHWTLAGSPYNIFNNVAVATGQSLIIDPGVEVVFQGFFSLKVNGAIISSGTSALPIVYRANDTSGWNDRYSVSGGWAGVVCEHSDSLRFEYCDVLNMKFAQDSGYGFSVINSNINIKNCNFYNNSIQSPLLGGILIWSLVHFEGSAVNISSCKFYNNYTTCELLRIEGHSLGASIVDCRFYDNAIAAYHGAGYIVSIRNNAIQFRNNETYNNKSSGGVFLSMNSGGQNVSLDRNRFYGNESNDAAISCFGGRTIIENNYICNNRDDSSDCGLSNGGGGIHISGFSSVDTFTFFVRNNIVANNFSTEWTGGIFIAECNAEIINNTVVNNSSTHSGGAICVTVDSAYHALFKTNRLTIRNNIFYGNTVSSITPSRDIYIIALSKLYLSCDHNWMQKGVGDNTFFMCSATGSVLIVGDTSDNFIGVNPGLNNPTHTADVNESAWNADFSLVASSQCINSGVVVPNIGYADYANNYRIFGTTIDIGAYEYGSNPFPLIAPLANPAKPANIVAYPNPASNLLFVTTAEVNGTLQLLDISGRQVAEQKVSTTTTAFDIHSIARGVYLAAWTNPGGEVQVQRVIVQ
jgi:predicted outer membrane repeat protein